MQQIEKAINIYLKDKLEMITPDDSLSIINGEIVRWDFANVLLPTNLILQSILDNDETTLIITVSAQQFKRALLRMEMFDGINTVIDSIGGEAKMAWDYSIEYSSNDVMLLDLATQMEIPSSVIQSVFELAATIE